MNDTAQQTQLVEMCWVSWPFWGQELLQSCCTLPPPHLGGHPVGDLPASAEILLWAHPPSALPSADIGTVPWLQFLEKTEAHCSHHLYPTLCSQLPALWAKKLPFLLPSSSQVPIPKLSLHGKANPVHMIIPYICMYRWWKPSCWQPGQGSTTTSPLSSRNLPAIKAHIFQGCSPMLRSSFL